MNNRTGVTMHPYGLDWEVIIVPRIERILGWSKCRAARISRRSRYAALRVDSFLKGLRGILTLLTVRTPSSGIGRITLIATYGSSDSILGKVKEVRQSHHLFIESSSIHRRVTTGIYGVKREPLNQSREVRAIIVWRGRPGRPGTLGCTIRDTGLRGGYGAGVGCHRNFPARRGVRYFGRDLRASNGTFHDSRAIASLGRVKNAVSDSEPDLKLRRQSRDDGGGSYLATSQW
jgi:hypothetical protein